MIVYLNLALKLKTNHSHTHPHMIRSVKAIIVLMEIVRQLSVATLHEKRERRKNKHIKAAVTGG